MSLSEVVTRDYRDIARHAGRVIKLRPDEILFREGDSARDMFVLISGQIAITSHGQQIETVQPGDGLGIVSLLDGKTRSTTATAVEDCEVAALDERIFRFVVENTPGFVWFVLGEMAQRLRATNAAL